MEMCNRARTELKNSESIITPIWPPGGSKTTWTAQHQSEKKKTCRCSSWLYKVKNHLTAQIVVILVFNLNSYFISTRMFKGLGTWFGLENPTYTKTSDDKENLSVEQEEKVVEAQNEVNKQQPADQDEGPKANQENSEQSKGLGGEKKNTLPYIYPCCFSEIVLFNVKLKVRCSACFSVVWFIWLT